MTESSSLKIHAFPKKEKLCSEKQINKLFSSGSSFIAYPLRVVYSIRTVSTEENTGFSVLTSVSKKKFKKAVDRNKIKRLIRETYRLNKNCFLEISQRNNLHIDIAFIYLETKIDSFDTLRKSMLKAANILGDRINNR